MNFERTRGKLFQKHAVRTQFDIYVFIIERKSNEGRMDYQNRYTYTFVALYRYRSW